MSQPATISRTSNVYLSATVPDGREQVLRRLVVIGASVAAASIVVTFFVGLVEGTVLPYDRLDPNSETSIFNWASAGATLIATFACVVHAIVSTRMRTVFGLLAALLLYASLDDSFTIHETIGTELSENISLAAKVGTPIWTVVYAPLLVAIAFLLWRVVRDGRPDARRLVAAGLLCFVAAIGFEVMGGTPIGEPLAVVVGEEAIELGGWELVATALTVLLVTTLLWYEHHPATGGERTRTL
jgi:hypothetical protein